MQGGAEPQPGLADVPVDRICTDKSQRFEHAGVVAVMPRAVLAHRAIFPALAACMDFANASEPTRVRCINRSSS